MEIDRENPRKALDTMNKAGELLKSGEVSVGVYPEGTRSKSGKLLPFHSGVLRIAQKGNSAIAVVAIRGTEKIHKNFPFRRSHVDLAILDVIPAKQVCTTRTNELCDTVREKIETYLKSDHQC